MARRSAWSEERRERQRQAIQRWRPWEKSTGPRTEEGKARSSRNAKRQPELQEAQIYLRLLKLRGERDAGAIGGRPLSLARRKVLESKIEVLEASLAPGSDLATFLAKSEKVEEDPSDLM